MLTQRSAHEPVLALLGQKFSMEDIAFRRSNITKYRYSHHNIWCSKCRFKIEADSIQRRDYRIPEDGVIGSHHLGTNVAKNNILESFLIIFKICPKTVE